MKMVRSKGILVILFILITLSSISNVLAPDKILNVKESKPTYLIYDNSDGSQSFVSDNILRYKDGNEWKKTKDIISYDYSKKVYSFTEGVYSVVVNKDSSATNFVSFTYNDETIGISAKQTNKAEAIYDSTNKVLTYENVWDNIDINYTFLPLELKEEIIINEDPQEDLYLTFKLDTDAKIKDKDNKEWDKETDKSMDKVKFEKDGKFIAEIPEIYAYDANDKVIPITQTFKLSGSDLELELYIFKNYTRDATYPIVIDPSLSVSIDSQICGHYEYDTVDIIASTVTVCDYNANGTSGFLNFTATNYINATTSSIITAVGAGYSGGDNAGAGSNGEGVGNGTYGKKFVGPSNAGGGGGGAGHAGLGGNTSHEVYESTGQGVGGLSYGNSTEIPSNLTEAMGSGGGSGAPNSGGDNLGGKGGNGGGVIYLYSPNMILDNIQIKVNSDHGNVAGSEAGGGGGGSGGSIILYSLGTINISSSNISTHGGTGGNNAWTGSGGGGSGGRIKIFYLTLYNDSSLFNVLAGAQTFGGSSSVPANGTIYFQNIANEPIINSNVTSPLEITLGNVFNVTADVTDLEGSSDIQGVYFNLTSPNGTLVIDSVNGSHISDDWTSSSYTIDLNGTWQVDIEARDSYDLTDTETFTFEVADSPSITPSTYVFAIKQNELENVTINITNPATTGFDWIFYEVSGEEINDTWFNISFSENITTSSNNTNVTDLIINIESNAPNETFYGNFTVERLYLMGDGENRTYKYELEISISSTLADVNWVSDPPVIVSFAGETEVYTYELNNSGDRDATACSITTPLNAYTSYNQTLFTIPTSGSISILATYENVPEGTYIGDSAVISCIATAGGGSDSDSQDFTYYAQSPESGSSGGSSIRPASETNIEIIDPPAPSHQLVIIGRANQTSPGVPFRIKNIGASQDTFLYSLSPELADCTLTIENEIIGGSTLGNKNSISCLLKEDPYSGEIKIASGLGDATIKVSVRTSALAFIFSSPLRTFLVLLISGVSAIIVYWRFIRK